MFIISNMISPRRKEIEGLWRWRPDMPDFTLLKFGSFISFIFPYMPARDAVGFHDSE